MVTIASWAGGTTQVFHPQFLSMTCILQVEVFAEKDAAKKRDADLALVAQKSQEPGGQKMPTVPVGFGESPLVMLIGAS